MIEHETTQLILRHVQGGLRCAMHAHPEFGLKGKHIGSVAKRIACGISGEVFEDIRKKMEPVMSKEFLYEEIRKENEALREKVESLVRSNRFFLEKLRENNISL